MPLVLAPRADDNRYSQDSFVFDLFARYQFSLLKKGPSGYGRLVASDGLVVSHNPDDPDDCLYLRRCRGQAASIIHLHYQFEYYSHQENVIESIGNATAAIVPTRALADQMARRFAQIPWYVVNNGVRTHLFYPSNSRERAEFRSQLGIPLGKKLIGFVGRLTEAKGLSVLERICDQIDNTGACLLIQFPYWHNSKDPDERERMKALAGELKRRSPHNIFVWQDAAPRYPNRPARFFDALLMPSLSELQPMVVLEALACGIPVIATRATAAYEELASFGFEDQVMQLTDLPSRFCAGDTKSFTLDNSEVTLIANDLFKNIKNLAPYSDQERLTLSDLLGRSGFVDAAMYGAWINIYRHFARQFQAA